FAFHGQVGDGFDGIFAEPEADVLEFKELLILLDDGVLGLGQNLDQGGAIQVLQHGAHRQTADEFRDETELDQIDRLGLTEQIDIAPPADAGGTADGLFLIGQEAHALLAGAARNYLFQTHESAAADKQDIGGVHGREFLVRVLAAALRGDVGNGAFQDFQKRLLDALARNVAGDGRVLVLTADLVDLVDVDDALLALLHVAIGRLEELEDDVLHVLADVPGFGQSGGIDNGERYIEDLGQGLRHQGFTRTGGTDQQNIRFLEFDLGVAHAVHVDPLAVVVNRHRQLLLGGLLPDHVLIQELFHFQWFRDLVRGPGRRLDLVVLEDGIADSNALVADIRTRIVAGRGNQLSDYVLTLMAKRTP